MLKTLLGKTSIDQDSSALQAMLYHHAKQGGKSQKQKKGKNW